MNTAIYTQLRTASRVLVQYESGFIMELSLGSNTTGGFADIPECIRRDSKGNELYAGCAVTTDSDCGIHGRQWTQLVDLGITSEGRGYVRDSLGRESSVTIAW